MEAAAAICGYRSEAFPALPDSPRAARRFVAAALDGWDVGGAIVDDAQLVVSELSTNAVEHVRSSFEVVARIEHGALRVAVRDESPAPPQLFAVSSDSRRGRGLHVVSAVADEWGVDVSDGGKTVWAMLAYARSTAGDS